MFEKAHIQSCLDYFQTDQDDFMQTVKIITPPLLPPVLHLHQGIALQCHHQFCLDIPFSKVWLLVSYHLYQQTIHGHSVTIPTIPTHCIIVPLVKIGQMNVIMTLLFQNPSPCLGTGHASPSTSIQTPP